MALSFPYFMSSIQILNTLSKTIIETLKTLVDDNLILNNFFMVKTTGARGPTLARLAMVLVWRACGKPSTKFPHGGLVECLFKKKSISNNEENQHEKWNFEKVEFFIF